MLKKSYKSAQYLDPEHALTYAFGKVNGVIIGDIDGNGYTDLVTFPSNFIYDTALQPVVWSNSKGVFTPSDSLVSNIGSYQYFRDSIPGDFNGDGRLDYVQVDQGWELNNRNTANFYGNTPALLLGTGSGLRWTDKLDWLESRAANQKTFNHIGDAADYDGDGDLDIAIAAFFDYRLYKNDGTGKFTWADSAFPASIKDSSGTTFIKLGGQYALIAGFYRTWNTSDTTLPLQVLAQDKGVFSPAYTLPRPDLGGRERNYGASDMYNVDINADGREDLLVTWETENSQGIDDGLSDRSGAPHTPRYKDFSNTIVSVYLQDKDGRLVSDPARKVYNLAMPSDSGMQLHFIDFNNDGFLDFYSTTYGIDIDKFDELIWLGDGQGGFYKPGTKMFETNEVLESWYDPSPFFFDANNDGAIDVISVRSVFGNDYATRNIGEEVTVFLNDSPPPAKAVRSLALEGRAAQYKLLTQGNQRLVVDPVTREQKLADADHVEKIVFKDLTLNLSVPAAAATIPASAVNRIIDLYIAFFSRVPDGGGLAYWIGQHAQGKGIHEIAESFYSTGLNFSSLTGYRADMSSSDFIHIVYRNVLGRPDGADPDGLRYWKEALEQGTQTKGSLVSSILDAAYGPAFSDPGNAYHWVQKLLLNKLDVARQVAIDWGLDYNSPEDSIRQGMAIAAAVTPDSTAAATSLVGLKVEAADLGLSLAA